MELRACVLLALSINLDTEIAVATYNRHRRRQNRLERGQIQVQRLTVVEQPKRCDRHSCALTLEMTGGQ
jgi:hypothetical protein